MTSFAKILVPTDFSDGAKLALNRALELKEPFGGTLTLLHVYQLPVIYPTWPGGPALSAETTKSTEDAAHASLGRLKEQAERRLRHMSDRATAKVLTKLVVGSPLDEIVEEARQGRYDLIVIGTHGHTGLKHLVLGSVAERVVRVAPCPVLTVRPFTDEERRRSVADSATSAAR